MDSLFGVKTVVLWDEHDMVKLGIEPLCLRSEVKRPSYRYTGQRKTGVQYQRCGGGRRVIRKKIGA